jgi:hypothetical protein
MFGLFIIKYRLARIRLWMIEGAEGKRVLDQHILDTLSTAFGVRGEATRTRSFLRRLLGVGVCRRKALAEIPSSTLPPSIYFFSNVLLSATPDLVSHEPHCHPQRYVQVLKVFVESVHAIQ